MRRLTSFRLALAALSGTVSAAHPHSTAATVRDTSDPVLEQQLDAVRRATAQFHDLEAAKRAGYHRFRLGADSPLMGEHWVNRDLLNQPVDLNRPAVLQYIKVGDRRVLVGVAYGHWQRPGDPFPRGFAGDSDSWHLHDMPALERRLSRHAPWYIRWAVDRRIQSGKVGGPDGRTQLAMVHAWIWSDNPDGMFANDNPALPYLRNRLPPAWARPHDHAAAMGIQLLLPQACPAALARMDRVVGTDDSQRSAMSRACTAAAGEVSAARARGLAGDSLNAIAAGAWTHYAGVLLADLTPGQRGELRALKGTMKMEGGHQGADGMEMP
jgi:hypothetical protein